jgi:hypothetical protein
MWRQSGLPPAEGMRRSTGRMVTRGHPLRSRFAISPHDLFGAVSNLVSVAASGR